MFSSSDLRGWSLKNDSALLVPGITHVHNIPAPEKLKKNKVGDINKCGIYRVYPPPANEGLVRDPLLKMFHNPGGDWNPGRGDNPRYLLCETFSERSNF